jgi:hypothetical protein
MVRLGKGRSPSRSRRPIVSAEWASTQNAKYPLAFLGVSGTKSPTALRLHPSGIPALRRPSMMRATSALKVGLS